MIPYIVVEKNNLALPAPQGSDSLLRSLEYEISVKEIYQKIDLKQQYSEA